MNRLTRLTASFLLLSMLAACSAPLSPPTLTAPSAPAQAGAPPAAWPSELFFVRPEGAASSLVAYDMADGSQRFSLPAGMLSADRKHFYAAEADGSKTGLRSFDPATGGELSRFTLDGAWALSGVSPTGRWLALTRIASASEKQAWIEANQWKTDVQIVDAQSGQTAHLLSLDGNFEVETISGKSLFLIQHLPAVNPDHYLIRLYDLSAEALIADPLRSKGSDEVMAGLAWEGVASPDGLWLLTLYLSTRRDVAFVHTLDLLNKYPVCIDLPSGGGDFDQLKYYSLTLSPDGQKVYATNAVLGAVAEVDLTQRQVTRTIFFDPDRSAPEASYDPQAPTARSAISRDGQRLYFTSGREVWVYDTRAGTVSGPYVVNTPVLGLGVSGDGKRLYVASAGQPLRVFDTASGQALSFQQASTSGQ
jgi:WD40 repeat protein